MLVILVKNEHMLFDQHMLHQRPLIHPFLLISYQPSVSLSCVMGRDQDVDSEEELTGSLKQFRKRTAASNAPQNASKGLEKPKPTAKEHGAKIVSATGRTCAAEGCSEHCCNGKPAFGSHIPAWDNMRYQALKKNDNEGDQEAWGLWMELNQPEDRG